MDLLNSGFIAVVLSFALYTIFVLLPMVPAIKIYRLFPDTKVGISGPLQGLSVKATGAFAAYVVTALLGFFLIQNAQHLISDYQKHNQSWVAKSRVEFLDANGKRIEGSDLEFLIKGLNVTVVPDQNFKTSELVKVVIPRYDEDTVVQYSVEGYLTTSKTLSAVERLDGNKLDLGLITLRPDLQHYNPEADQLEASVDAAPAVEHDAASGSSGEPEILATHR